jgi:hypothetical protein
LTEWTTSTKLQTRKIPSQQPERQDKRLRKHDDKTKKMKKLFALFTANTKKQLIEQAEKHAIEIFVMKQTNMETKNLLMMKTMPAQPVNDHRASVHFTVMIKLHEILFGRKP